MHSVPVLCANYLILINLCCAFSTVCLTQGPVQKSVLRMIAMLSTMIGRAVKEAL